MIKINNTFIKYILFFIFSLNTIQANDFTRANNVVSDNDTSLQWQDTIYGGEILTYEWIDAITHCENLNLDGNSDWRLPNKHELLSILDYTKYNPPLDAIFQEHTNGVYWTSTTYAGDTTQAWYIKFNYGKVYYLPKDEKHMIRCVRSTQ